MIGIKNIIILLYLLLKLSNSKSEDNKLDDVRVFTVATEETDGYKRYIRSAQHYSIKVTTLGLNQKWNGGDMTSVGGGQKVNMLREALESLKNNKNTIILFTDSYDVVFTSGLGEIIKKFKNTHAKVLFGAENFCWPDDKLRNQYPVVQPQAARFLNSGMFMGYAPELYGILTAEKLSDADDDQLFYTNIFLNEKYRKQFGIQLDTKSEIFQNLNGATDIHFDVNLDSGEGKLHNTFFLTDPHIIHGNGPSKIFLNSIANYLAGTFQDKICIICDEDIIKLKEDNLPIISMAIFIEKAVPFFEQALDKILALNYPKKNINLFIHSNIEYHDKIIKNFIERFGTEYKTAKHILSVDQIDERTARKLSIQQAEQKSSNYLFVVDNEVHLNDPNTLRNLLSYNRSFIAPVLAKQNELWSNFWGDISNTGYYARSHDYVDIVKGNVRGMWNVPFVSSCYLVKRSAFKYIKFSDAAVDPDMALCADLRNAGIFMNVINVKNFGHLINYDEFNVNTVRPEFGTLLTNPQEWEQQYIHQDYYKQLEPGYKHQQPCPDVYWFPIVNEKFCDDLIAVMEGYGKWSSGTSDDTRLQGGYEAVPTRDIHMNQVGLEVMWLRFLKLYVRPLQEAVFTGYYHNPPRSLMNFVVRYRPDEQPFLKPHHDSSTYTINIALNTPNVDYIGGGCKFIRYNCSVVDTKKGWVLLHPGRLTHYHEGLYVTNGTRNNKKAGGTSCEEDQPPRKKGRRSTNTAETNTDGTNYSSNTATAASFDTLKDTNSGNIENDLNKMQQNHQPSAGSTSSASSGNNINSQNSSSINNEISGGNGGSTNSESNGHANNENNTFAGGDGDKNGTTGSGSGKNGFTLQKLNLDKTNQDIVRLIGQYLKNVGLDKTADILMQESGCYLEHPSATKFRQHVLSGDWTKADNDLKELQPIIEKKVANFIEMKFLILEQKYLEYLEDGRPYDALHVLRNELTPLQHNINRVHQLSSYMMCSNNHDLYQRANWEGKGIVSRSQLMERLQSYLPSSVMLPPRRLRSLLNQAVELQTERCICHGMAWETNLENISLLSDHSCNMDGFPLQTLQILSDHCDEVWFCKFSPDGLKLATGSKDSTVKIWDVDPIKLTLNNGRSLDMELQYGVGFIDWSPDSKFLLAGGPDDSPEICVYNIDEGKLITKFNHAMDESLTCGAFNKDGTRFVTGGTKGQFYLCDISGNLLDSWEGVRVNALAFRADNKTVLAADSHYRIRGYAFCNPRSDFKLIQEQNSILTFTINSTDRLALLNISSQGLHLWDLEDKCLVRRFQGTSQGTYAIYSSFGGIHENYIASGSEDYKVYIWHIKNEEPLAKLIGHTKTVNCVSWNPVYPALLASASDDGTVRIWGPKAIQQINNSESDETSSCSSSSSWNITT